MAEYKAILFDVGGTLAIKDKPNGVFILRSETLPQTLETLSNQGVKLFMVSMDSYLLMRQGVFREGLLKPEDPEHSKLRAFQQILKENNLKPNEVLAIGDDEHSEGSAARTLGINFIKVDFMMRVLQFPIPGNKEALELALKAAFPSVFSKDVLSDASGLKRKKAGTEVPPPKKLIR